MDKTLIDIIMGIVFLIIGSSFVIFNKQIGRWTWGIYEDLAFTLFKRRPSVKGYQLGFLVCGIIMAISGLLIILRII